MKLGPSKLNPARSIYYIMTHCEVLDSSFFDTIFLSIWNSCDEPLER